MIKGAVTGVEYADDDYIYPIDIIVIEENGERIAYLKTEADLTERDRRSRDRIKARGGY